MAATATSNKMSTGDPITRAYLLSRLPLSDPRLPQNWREGRQQSAYYQESDGKYIEEQGDPAASKMLDLLDKYGANSAWELPPEVRAQIPNGGTYKGDDSSFWTQLRDFVTSPPFLMMAGGAGAMGAFGGAAAAGGAAGGATAAEEAAMLTGSGGAGGGSLGGAYGAAAGAGAATALPGEAGYLGADAPLTATTGATNTLPGQVAGTAAGGSALSRLLAGNATADDWAQIIGTGVDTYGAYQQSQDVKAIADRNFAMGAPYRDELTRISADPNAFYSSPTATKATESVLQRLSATHGNPAGSPYAQALTVDAMYDNYGRERDRLAGYGGLTAYTTAGPSSAMDAAGANANLWNTIGGGVADLGTPRRQNSTLADYLAAYKKLGGTV